ncbi:MAG: D-cysteine desulfhydrase family protein [Ignavibacteriales bacterium]
MNIGTLPRIRLANLPTPLEEARRLGEALGGVRLFVKRDDDTGLATGGNKARKLEFVMGDAVRQGCDTVITTGGVQSNHARMTAAAAAKLGMKRVLVLEGSKPEDYQGNLLLDKVLGAELSFVPEGSDVDAEMAKVASRLRAEGAKPFVIPLGGSTPTGAVGYVLCAMEMVSQVVDMGLKVDQVFIATGSGGTMAGLLLGLKALAPGAKVWGISVGKGSGRLRDTIAGIASEAADLVGWPVRVEPEEVLIDDSYVGEGYGIPSPECIDATRLAANTEGLILDPVYTGKAMAGLMGHVKQGMIRPGETVVFVHTGGAASLFAYDRWF